MIDPAQVVEAFKTKSLLVPTSSIAATSSVAPIPTVIPNQPVYQRIGDAGSKTLWVVFVVLLLSTLVLTYLSFRVPVQKRLFHVITTFITLFATIAYFAMATGDGSALTETIIKETKQHLTTHIFRQVFWARYVNWLLTSPLILLDLAFLAGLDGASTIVALVADVLTVLLSLFAAHGSTDGQKWGYYAMSLIAYLVIVYQFVVSGRRAVSTKDNKTAKTFASIGGFTLIVWTLYPIVWGLADGSRTWGVDAEIIAYAVLDLLAIPVFAFWLIFAHAASDSRSIEGWWSHGLSNEGAIRIEENGA